MGKFFKKPRPQLSDRIPPGQYETKGFPLLTYGSIPEVRIENWEFRVWGLAKEKTFTRKRAWEHLALDMGMKRTPANLFAVNILLNILLKPGYHKNGDLVD